MNETAGVRHLEVPAEQAGQRIDNFLLRQLKGVPKSWVYRILRRGEVRVNRGRIRPDHRLRAGDTVRIPPLRESAVAPPPAPPRTVLAQLQQAVLWEDADVLILDKPAGLAVHKGSGLAFGVIEALRALRPHAPFLELAHRLDRETSGCLALAKTPAALATLQAALRAGTVDKRYLALVRGQWPHGTLEVAAPLRKNVLRGGERSVEVLADGKPARTRFKPVQLFRLASLLEATIATGRTHQIRVHAAHAGHPVAGDPKYGDSAFNRALQPYGLHRLFLHAHSLAFSLGGRDIDVSAPLDADLKAVLDELERRS